MSKDKIKELLSVLDMSLYDQYVWLHKQGLIHGESPDSLDFDHNETRWRVADLAFRINGDLLDGKKPIKWIIDALIAKKPKRKKLDAN